MGGRGGLYGQPAQQDLASIPRVDTPEDADEGGLTGAVFADESVNFARAHFERHVLQRAHTREGFGDALHLEKRNVHGWHVTLREHSEQGEHGEQREPGEQGKARCEHSCSRVHRVRDVRASQKVTPLCRMMFAYGVYSPVRTTART